MNEILCVTSSPRGDTSYSNLVAARVLREIRAVQPHANVTIRDLAHNPLPHIDDDFVTATRSVAGSDSTGTRPGRSWSGWWPTSGPCGRASTDR